MVKWLLRIPADALDFFVELEGNNDRPWWQANKERFEQSVAEPMRALLDELEPEFGVFKVFRMNRDVRFSADKSPYKTAHAAVTERDGGAPSTSRSAQPGCSSVRGSTTWLGISSNDSARRSATSAPAPHSRRRSPRPAEPGSTSVESNRR